MTARARRARTAFLVQLVGLAVGLGLTVAVSALPGHYAPAAPPRLHDAPSPASPRDALLHDLEQAQARDLADVERSAAAGPPSAVHVPSRVR